MNCQKQACIPLSDLARSLVVALAERDCRTGIHSDRVFRLSSELAMQLDFSRAELDQLALGSRFHDIGKIGIPDHILHKPTAFDETEWQCMQQHVVIGERIVVAIGTEQSFEVARIIRHHHEHFDGSGYPDRLSGTAIPLFARVIALADSYDAIAVQRPYHPARTHRDIMDILHSESGIKHDPDLLHAFTRIIETSEMRAS